MRSIAMLHHSKVLFPILSACVICMGIVSISDACSAFSLAEEEVLITGKSYDWDIGHGLVIVNPRRLEKSFGIFGRGTDDTWISKYGSVTFNQYGRDLPQSGMNEAGLVIEVLWLNETSFPPDDARQDLDVSRWIQYQLDTAASVDDVINSFERIQIRSNITVHYFISDRSGNAATVEFVEGKRIIHSGNTLPVSAITNSTYVNSLEYLETLIGSGSTHEPAAGPGSLNRFVRVAKGLKDFDGEEEPDPVVYAFDMLDEVKNPGYTQWQLVYDQKTMMIHYRTAGNPEIRKIDMEALQFDCSIPPGVLDIHASPDANGTLPWKAYTQAINRALIDETYNETPFLAATPDSIRALVAGYPDKAIYKSEEHNTTPAGG